MKRIIFLCLFLVGCNWGLKGAPGDGGITPPDGEDADGWDGVFEVDTEKIDVQELEREELEDLVDAVDQIPDEIEFDDVQIDEVTQEEVITSDGIEDEIIEDEIELEPVCGNGVVEPPEGCDNGANNSDTVPDACRTDCSRAHCGDGVVDTGEACDNTTSFCDSSCNIVCPSGWTTCTGATGTACLQIVDWSGNHNWEEFRDHCAEIIAGMSPVDYEYYGLAVFSDSAIWDCIRSSLSTSVEYFIGLYQYDTSGRNDEGWCWYAYKQSDSSWGCVDTFVDGNPIDGSFDNAGGGGHVECGRVNSSGTFYDYSCTSQQPWDGICMIQF